jgi:hypothetical protein
VGLFGGPVRAESARQVIGTIAVQGDVQTRDIDPADAQLVRVTQSGTALLERTLVKVGGNGAALLALRKDGVVGVRASSTARVGTRGQGELRVDLESGEALVRLPAGSPLIVATPTATVRAEPIVPVSTAGGAAEASIKILADGQTLVRVEVGTVRVDGAAGGPSTRITAGEEASFPKEGAPEIARAATAKLPAADVGAKPGGKDGSAFYTDPILLGLLGAAAVGGTVGGLAGSGAIGSSDDDGDDNDSSAAAGGGGGDGSPFRTSR